MADVSRMYQQAGVVGLRHADVTPSDTDDFSSTARRLWVGTGGDVAAVDVDGTAVTYKNVPSGSYLEGAFARVNATNTTATDIIVVW